MPPLFVIPFPEIDPVAVSIGPLAIRWYALAYVFGLLLAVVYAKHLVRRPALWEPGEPPVTPHQLDDFLLWAVAGVILGGRLGYAIFYQPGHYLDDPLAFFRVWQGGMSFHGGLTGVILAAILFALRRGVPPLSLRRFRLKVSAVGRASGAFMGRPPQRAEWHSLA